MLLESWNLDFRRTESRNKSRGSCLGSPDCSGEASTTRTYSSSSSGCPRAGKRYEEVVQVLD
jgi:hypothetical protein